MSRAVPTFGRIPPLAYGPVSFDEAERAGINQVCPKPGFMDAVASLAAPHRAAIEHENLLPTAAEVRAKLGEIKRQSEDISAVAQSLCTLIAELDELTLTKLPRSGPLVEWIAPAGSIARAFAEKVQNSIDRLDDDLKRKAAVAPGRAGVAVKALFIRFDLPYTVTSRRDTTQESPAVFIFRIVSGIQTGRVDHYLP